MVRNFPKCSYNLLLFFFPVGDQSLCEKRNWSSPARNAIIQIFKSLILAQNKSQLSCTNSAGCLATDALLGASLNSLWESLLPPNFFNKVSGVHFEKVSSLIPSFLLYNPILIS